MGLILEQKMEVKKVKTRKSKSELICYRGPLYFSVKYYVVLNLFIMCLYNNTIKYIKSNFVVCAAVSHYVH